MKSIIKNKIDIIINLAALIGIPILTRHLNHILKPTH